MNTLAALREAERKATPGPGKAEQRRRLRAVDRTVAEVFYTDANAALICLLRNHADALLAVAEAAREFYDADSAIPLPSADEDVTTADRMRFLAARDRLRAALAQLGEGE